MSSLRLRGLGIGLKHKQVLSMAQRGHFPIKMTQKATNLGDLFRFLVLLWYARVFYSSVVHTIFSCTNILICVQAVGTQDYLETDINCSGNALCPETGSVYIFTSDDASGTSWTQQGEKIKNPNPTDISDRFGDSVALSSDGLLLVGASQNDEFGSNNGNFYLYAT